MHNFIYFVEDKKFLISDPLYCAKSERTFDMPFNELATNEQLISLLGLVPIFADKPDGIRWFASYLSQFHRKDHPAIYNKLLTNPMVRILAISEDVFKKINDVLNCDVRK